MFESQVCIQKVVPLQHAHDILLLICGWLNKQVLGRVGSSCKMLIHSCIYCCCILLYVYLLRSKRRVIDNDGINFVYMPTKYGFSNPPLMTFLSMYMHVGSKYRGRYTLLSKLMTCDSILLQNSMQVVGFYLPQSLDLITKIHLFIF